VSKGWRKGRFGFETRGVLRLSKIDIKLQTVLTSPSSTGASYGMSGAVSPNLFSDDGSLVGMAFHGTHEVVGNQIASNGFHLPGKASAEQRMGRGVYFWEGSQRAAQRWARKHYSDDKQCAIRARLKLGKHINLNILEHQEAFSLIAKEMLRSANGRSVSEGQVFNFLVNKGWIHTARRVHFWDEKQQFLAEGVDEPWATGPSDTMLCVYITALIEAPCIVWRSS